MCIMNFARRRPFELLDRSIYDALGVSGHTLKHITAGAATAVVAWWVYARRPLPEPSTDL